jgi:DNA repair ATPase RecN
VTKQKYGIKISTILNAAEKLNADLDYLCSIEENPDPEFPIADALAYARAVSAIANHLDFVVEDLTENDLSENEEYVKLSQDDIVLMSRLTEISEDAIKILEKTCGIYLQNN